MGMKNYLSVLLALLLPINSYGQQQNVSEFVSEFTGMQFDKAYQKLNQELQDQIPKNELPLIWKMLTDQNGELTTYGFNCKESSSEFQLFFYTFYFENQTLDLQITLSLENEKIAGFFFVPVHICGGQKKYSLPNYYDENIFQESTLEIESDSILLNASITLPFEYSDFICILIHGSGPQDRDATIGLNKPFKDLAIGLAMSGIASVRYDKRTYTYQDNIENITIEKEVIDDVSAIIKYIKSATDLRDRDIYLIGHSLGGMLAPKVALQNPVVKGIIYLAANFSPLEKFC